MSIPIKEDSTITSITIWIFFLKDDVQKTISAYLINKEKNDKKIQTLF